MNKIQKCELCDTSVSFPMDNIQEGAAVCAACKEKYLMPKASQMGEATEALRELKHARECFTAKKEATADAIRERKATEEIEASERFLHERQEQRLQEALESLENQKAVEKSGMERVIIGLLQALIVMVVAGIAGFLAGALSGCSSLPQEPEVVTTTMCGIKVSVPVPPIETDCYNEWWPAICEYFEVLVENEDWETLHRKLRLMRRDRELYAAFATLLNYQDMEFMRDEKTLRERAELNINKLGAPGDCTQARVDTIVLWVYLSSKEFRRCLDYYARMQKRTEGDELIASVARLRMDLEQ